MFKVVPNIKIVEHIIFIKKFIEFDDVHYIENDEMQNMMIFKLVIVAEKFLKNIDMLDSEEVDDIECVVQNDEML